MSYVLVAILLLLVTCAIVTVIVLSATKRSSPARADSEPPAIASDDETPLGDTSARAGEQDRGADDDSRDHAGEGELPRGRFQRDPVGGEAEARPFIEAERPRP